MIDKIAEAIYGTALTISALAAENAADRVMRLLADQPTVEVHSHGHMFPSRGGDPLGGWVDESVDGDYGKQEGTRVRCALVRLDDDH